MQKFSREKLVSIKNLGICFKRQRKLTKSKKNSIFWALKDVSFDIFKNEMENFLDNPFFGIGVGSGKFKRIEDDGDEFS